MSQTQLAPDQLAALIDPNVLAYIDARMDMLADEVHRRLLIQDDILRQGQVTTSALADEVRAEAAKMKNIIDTNPNLQITKAKLIQIAKELNL